MGDRRQVILIPIVGNAAEHATAVCRRPLAQGESVIKHKSSLNVLKDTYDYSCC